LVIDLEDWAKSRSWLSKQLDYILVWTIPSSPDWAEIQT
jgi:hypothetical protein